MFALNTVQRSHRVLHSQDLMSIIGTYVVASEKENTQAFKETCRFWRHVYYTKLFNVASLPLDRRTILFKKLAGNAAALSMPPGSKMGLLHLDLVLSQTNDASSILHFIRAFQSKSCWVAVLQMALSETSNCCIRLLEMKYPTQSTTEYQENLTSFLFRLVLIEAPLTEIIAYLCGKLNQSSLETVYKYVLQKDKNRAHLLFPYMKVTLDMAYLYFYAFRDAVITRAELLCRALSRDLFVDHYIECIGIEFFPHRDADFCDAFLRIGAETDNFVKELFQFTDQHFGINRALIQRYIVLGFINPCTTDRYKFGTKGIGWKTIFEYASYVNDKLLFIFITRDPRFKPADHLNILALGPRVNMHRMSIDFLEHCKLDKEELELGLQLVNEGLAKSKKKELGGFATVISKLNKLIAKEGQRKRAKLIIKIDGKVVEPRR